MGLPGGNFEGDELPLDQHANATH
ncbi:uncharacterized protein G2W53_016407 [Senna tora]|uniref:Uncharacterized protein n=1 Tax=Senna tora TaxID=362788 RepID=A0A834WLH7_9FABA|nr:uncharacterized protein G2W53_016407 [Senna tora]